MKIIKPNNYVLVDSNVVDTTYAAYDTMTAYVTNDFISVASNHAEYQAVSNNTGKDPLVSANIYDPINNPLGCWKFLGTTNRWKQFDQYLNTQTVNEGSITFTVTCYDAQAIFIGNIDVDSVQIQIKDNYSGNIIEDVTYSLVPDPIDWMDYFYGAWIDRRKRNIIYDRTTLTRDISIIIVATAAIAKIGTCIFGYAEYIGATLWQFKKSGLDYSTVVIDTQTGYTSLAEGNYAKLISATLFIPTSISDEVDYIITGCRGKPIVFYDNLEIALLYGFLKTHDMNMNGPAETKIDLKLQGLI